jgi:hypothetical protein
MGIFILAQYAIMLTKLYFSFMRLPLMWSVQFFLHVHGFSCAILLRAGSLEAPALYLGSYDYSLDQGSVLLNDRPLE